jgi:hypothetical protein
MLKVVRKHKVHEARKIEDILLKHHMQYTMTKENETYTFNIWIRDEEDKKRLGI